MRDLALPKYRGCARKLKHFGPEKSNHRVDSEHPCRVLVLQHFDVEETENEIRGRRLQGWVGRRLRPA
jgi:hypothetical protein